MPSWRMLCPRDPTAFPQAVTARGCLAPGANVCVATPANQINSAIRVFFQDFRHRGCEPTFGVPSSSLLAPSPFLSSPLPFYTRSSPSLKLKVGPLNPARRSGERCKLPSGVWGGAPAKIEFGAFWP